MLQIDILYNIMLQSFTTLFLRPKAQFRKYNPFVFFDVQSLMCIPPCLNPMPFSLSPCPAGLRVM